MRTAASYDNTATHPRVEEPEATRRTLADVPWVTLLMEAVIVVVFVMMWRAGQGHIELVAQQFGDKNKQLIDAGQTWRFVTPIFLHGSWVHLIVNSISLLWLGSQMENIYGGRRYFLIYMISGITGNLASYYGSPGPSLGASGAIFGLIGAGLIFPIRFRSLLPDEARNRILSQLLGMAVLNLGIGFSMQGVDNYAHMGGLIGGGFAALFLLPDVLDDRPRNLLREAGLWLGVLAMLGVIVWAVSSQRKIYTPLVFTPMLVRYSPAEQNQWWSVAIPTGWTRQGNQWRNRYGATFEFTDSIMSHDLVKNVEQAAEKAHAYIFTLNLNGRPTRKIVLQTRDHIEEFWLTEAQGQTIIFRLECSQPDYPKTEPDMFGILATLLITGPLK